MDPLLAFGVAQGASALFDVIGSIGKPSAEEIYRKRLDEAAKLLKNYYGSERINTINLAARDRSMARQLSSRIAASQGRPGDTAPYTSPAESVIERNLSDSLNRVRSAELGALANLQFAGMNFPIVDKPNAAEYIGAAFRAGGNIAGTAYQFDRAADLTAQSNKVFADNLNATFTNAVNSMGGQNSLDGVNSRFTEINFGAPPKGSEIASNFFTFGSIRKPRFNPFNYLGK